MEKQIFYLCNRTRDCNCSRQCGRECVHTSEVGYALIKDASKRNFDIDFNQAENKIYYIESVTDLEQFITEETRKC